MYLFTDGLTRVGRGPPSEPKGDVPVGFHVWDLERLYRFDTSGLDREPIDVDIE